MFKIGIGYDVHRLVEGRKLILGGVEIPYEKGLLGHSDADVLIHAICDALLGAAGLGDIGKHFPDTDQTYKGISSILLLRDVQQKIFERNFIIGNIDATIIAERPKLNNCIPQMQKNLAEILEMQMEQVNVKATTTEGLGFAGKGEGIAAQAVALIEIYSTKKL
ncbi:MAG: 2-C-methyl-D-erythritol 2,4-cyclodiphosphate synthase [bacterium]